MEVYNFNFKRKYMQVDAVVTITVSTMYTDYVFIATIRRLIMN